MLAIFAPDSGLVEKEGSILSLTGHKYWSLKVFKGIYYTMYILIKYSEWLIALFNPAKWFPGCKRMVTIRIL